MNTVRELTGSLETWCFWLLVTGFSWPVGLLVAWVTVQGANVALSARTSLALGVVVGGSAIGLVQWPLLRSLARGLVSWVLATGIGWSLGLLVAAYGVGFAGLAVGAVIGGAALGGSVFGLAQWLALRTAARGAGEWILVMAEGWAASLGAGMLLREGAPVLIRDGPVGLTVLATAGWLVVGCLALCSLILVFPNPQRTGSDAFVRWWPKG